VALFVLEPFGYFRSRGQKKNHSISRFGRNDFSTVHSLDIRFENLSNNEIKRKIKKRPIGVTVHSVLSFSQYSLEIKELHLNRLLDDKS
jgi:hypothetical protein